MTGIARASKDAGIWPLVISAACGYLDVTSLVIVPLAVILTLMSVVFQIDIIKGFVGVERQGDRFGFVAISLLTSLGFVVGSYAAGLAAHWVIRGFA